jgi:hypothetical protein
MDPVWDMFVKTYKSIGLAANSAEEMLGEFPIWEICHGDNGDAVAFNAFKKTKYGLKSGLSGSDGSSDGKSKAIEMIRTKFKKPGYYGEVSHKVEAIALASGAPVICNSYVSSVLGKQIEPSDDQLHYSRNLGGVGRVTKIMVGMPNGVPTTDFNNPSCPNVSVRLASDGWCDEDEGMDKFAHLSCLHLFNS